MTAKKKVFDEIVTRGNEMTLKFLLNTNEELQKTKINEKNDSQEIPIRKKKARFTKCRKEKANAQKHLELHIYSFILLISFHFFWCFSTYLRSKNFFAVWNLSFWRTHSFKFHFQFQQFSAPCFLLWEFHIRCISSFFLNILNVFTRLLSNSNFYDFIFLICEFEMSICFCFSCFLKFRSARIKRV